MENDKTSKEKEKQVRKEVDKKIDEFNEETFPASDPPNWSALKHFKENATRPESKESDLPHRRG